MKCCSPSTLPKEQVWIEARSGDTASALKSNGAFHTDRAAVKAPLHLGSAEALHLLLWSWTEAAHEQPPPDKCTVWHQQCSGTCYGTITFIMARPPTLRGLTGADNL